VTDVARPFLTADWRHLLMLNYDVDADSLTPFLPRGTELDLWQGRAIISLVGFRFLNTRIKGWRIPFHQEFAEVNLRFYVRRAGPEGWRRGVVFLREVSPKRAVRWVANTIYDEQYLTLPMSYRVQIPASATDRTGRAEYHWRSGNQPFQMSADFHGLPSRLTPDSEAEFIAEHYWGYTRHADGSTSEYRVEHPPWRAWPVTRAEFQCDAAALYGAAFATALAGVPRSALMLDGSAVSVSPGQHLPRGEMDMPLGQVAAVPPTPAAASPSSPVPAR